MKFIMLRHLIVLQKDLDLLIHLMIDILTGNTSQYSHDSEINRREGENPTPIQN